MKICIQDPRGGRTYVLGSCELDQYRLNGEDEAAADILFVMPSRLLVEELPAVRSSASTRPSVLICDPDHDRRWLLAHADLERFSVAWTPDAVDDEAVWFSMPDDCGVLGVVPFFRRALVQNSS